MSAGTATESAERKLAAVVGVDNVTTDRATRETLAIDGVCPAAAVAPGSAEEMAAVLRVAWEDDLVVVPAGGGTRLQIGRVPERVDILLDTCRLNQVERYDPGDLTISVGAGMTVTELRRTLAEHRQFLPLDPAQPERATIGGSLASAAHGPLKHFYGGAREFCVGVRFATADGKLAKGGGHVVKNVAGYDMMKLLIGSFGTLGVIVSANFKLFPQPRQTRTFLCEFANLRDTLAFRDRVVQSPLTPMCLEIASPGVAFSGEAAWRIYLRAAGSDAVLARYRKELGTAVTREIEREPSDFVAEVLTRNACAMTIEMSVPIQAVADVIAGAERAAAEQGFACAIVGHVGVGALVAAFIPFGGEPPSVVQYANAVSALRSVLPRDGSAVVTRCPVEAKRHFDVWGSTPSDLDAMRTVRRTLDEKQILNRGRFLV